MTTVRRWSGREAGALRAALRMTIRGFAEYLGVSPRTVAYWQAKGPTIAPLPEMQAALDTALATAAPDARERFEALLQSEDSSVQAARDQGHDVALPVHRLEFPDLRVERSAAQRPMTTTAQVDDLLAHLRDQWHLLVKTDNLLGPRYALYGVLDQLRIINDLLRCVRESARTAVLRVAAQYAESAAWLHEDGGQLAMGRYWNSQAMQWAHEADDRQMIAWTLFRSGQQVAAHENGGQVIGLARAARREADRLPAPMLAAIAQQEAQGHALDGDEAESQRLFDAAHEWAATDTEGDARSGHGSFCTQAYIEVQRAASWLTLRKPTRAIELYERELPNLPPVYRRDRGRALGRMAAAHLIADQPEQAVCVAREALAIGQAAGSVRTLNEVTTVAQSLRSHRQFPAVAQLLDDLAQSTA